MPRLVLELADLPAAPELLEPAAAGLALDGAYSLATTA
jgi:hypothetical protein